MVKRRLFSQIFLSVLIVFTLFAVFSCSMFDLDSSTSSVSFSFSGEFIRNIKSGVSSRSADNEINTENLYAEISLLGSYTDTKTAVLSEGTTITFQEIPVDSKIYAKAEVYELTDGEKTIFYEGKSEEITVKDGENTLVLKMRSSGGQIELTSKPVTLATALKAGAEIVCAYSETKWGETSQVSCSFKYENGAYINTTTSGYTDATLTFDETENTLTVVFTEDVYIDTTIFYISSSQYKYKRVMDESSTSANSGSTMSFSSITINGEDITSTLTQSS